MNRILLIANKNWEVEPILNALLNKVLRPAELGDPTTLHYPWKKKPGSKSPRAVWKNTGDSIVELWCVQDIMDKQWNPSSSQGKMAALPKISAYSATKPNMVIALGTAAFGDPVANNNGCVVMGSNIFIHNYHPNGSNKLSKWDDPVHCEKLLTSDVSRLLFDAIGNASLQKSVGQNLLKPFLNPADNIRLIVNKDFTAISNVNVTDYAEYYLSDPAGMQAFKNAGPVLPVGSVESTHGLIRLLYDCPFFFLSGITDRFEQFNADVNGTDSQGYVKTNAQNFTAAFNIGVALSWILPEIIR